ncbi:23S rRNA (uracil(1939)-C(5))-methyltransferase RlmD [Candidatus Woesearchaeota archaeon]|nr:23S rRNA (uracil(1939)-C(5))-methyltransferase RlmD [Candidatus Woesearchaeota archaeon]
MDKKYYQKLLTKIITQNAKREIKPKCKHFKECGGCDYQNYTHQDQINAKRKIFEIMTKKFKLHELFENQTMQTIQSSKEYEYRQRMDYVCAFGKTGLRKKEKYDEIINLEECQITPKKSFKAYEETTKLAKTKKLEFYNYKEHQGYLRYISVRQTTKNQTMIIIVTKNEEHEQKIEEIAKHLLKNKYCESIHWTIQNGKADTSLGIPHKHWGKKEIQEEILNKKFLIGPNTFFQSNQETAEKAFKKIKEYKNKNNCKKILDLYSGTGVIGIATSDTKDQITSIDNSQENQKIATKNIKLNKIKNIKYQKQDAKEFLKQNQENYDLIIIDPPRAGLGQKNTVRIMLAEPKHIAYMSCNPITLLEDLKILKQKYKIQKSYIIDMFPQTKHLETLILMKKITNTP